ncbi:MULTISPECIES: LysR substrate-binding domain-containing protein [unclassified Herbaspirillum]|uniref:LysR substrate-binding domain-containing protein n=1 Tax=unclassified Herbaspirillum TaxID=2624150 RepID=UPI000E2F265C|nr:MULTISPECIES: LysR substrate-binding domain-containing protein [unclassified Herbaspirillum]RFB65617.1 LysR family transcriptional regulator [Herbaspirillum sp. 3R-3a1]TFI09080.1 LysR family transcriptional regulator [Herbaspirillum sp. 3R11]TFI15498.1 LysR family transcriptional regulator [Herbaspirillum sp. 3R-11]TFI21587.1 LysR family transcriptional regulator [Herbaspirillum sp. 3C11]
MFRISLDALLILDAIDRRGSFSAAGLELHRVPSTISYTVSKLEQDLGVQVFDRQGPKVVLTRAGEELLKEGRYLLKAAEDLEHRVRRVASGWETEFTIGLDSLYSAASLESDIVAFYQVADRTRLRIARESLAGTWEALLDRRVDLLIAAPGEGPAGGGYVAEQIGTVKFVFVVAPHHPLAKMDKVLSKADLHPYRAISVADSARKMPPRTVGLLFGQDTLTVPDMRSKYALQLAGVGFGFLPEPCVQKSIASGTLIVKEVEQPRAEETFSLAWRVGEDGAALTWWLKRMRETGVLNRMLSQIADGGL